MLSVNWHELLTVIFTPGDLWNAFGEVLNSAIELCVPCTFCCCQNPKNICDILVRFQTLFVATGETASR
jgi:hypothetical protein